MSHNQESPFSEHDVVFIRHSTRIAKQIIAKVNTLGDSGVVSGVLGRFSNRLVASIDSLLLLVGKAIHNIDADAETIVRGMYDAMLQGLWVIADHGRADERANLYLDYYWVEKHRLVHLFDNNTSELAKRIAASKNREGNEEEIERQYARIEAKYLGPNGRVRRQWYPGSLYDLARDVQLLSEYEILQRFLSGTVHTNTFATTHGATLQGMAVIVWGFHFLHRFLGRAADYLGLELTEEERKLVDHARENIYDSFPDDQGDAGGNSP